VATASRRAVRSAAVRQRQSGAPGPDPPPPRLGCTSLKSEGKCIRCLQPRGAEV